MTKGSIAAIALALLFLPAMFQPPLPTDAPGSDGARTVALCTAPPGGVPSPEGLLSGMEGSFTENLGQLRNPSILLYARGGPLSAGLMRDGVLFTHVQPDEGRPDDLVAFAMIFEGCNDVVPEGCDALPHRSNHFIGNDTSRWATGARSFREVRYEGIWDGIDLVFYFKGGMLKYDFVVDAGADPADIVMRYDGIESLGVDDRTGDLLVHAGQGTLRDQRPIILRSRGGEATDWPVCFVPSGDSIVTLGIPDTRALAPPYVIDPGLIWSTYVGGSGMDYPQGVALDDNGDLYCVGNTKSTDFPTTPGVLDEDLIGDSEAFLMKLSSKDGSLLMATYFGGSGFDQARDLSISSDGDISIVGCTSSIDLPVTDDAIKRTKVDVTDGDAFLIVISPDGSRLKYGTYLGGNGYDYGFDIQRIDDGTVYIDGATYSNDLPMDPWAYCSVRTASRQDSDVFVMRLSSDLSRVLNCTYLGGSDDELSNLDTQEWVSGSLQIDCSGQVLIAGTTWSMDFPTTDDALRRLASYFPVGFIAKLDGNLSTLLSATYLGGTTGWDVVESMTVGTDGTVYATGSTSSDNFPVTADAFCSTSQSIDGYLVAIDNGLSTLRYGTYLGGNSRDWCHSIVLGPDGSSIYISGATMSCGLEVPPGGFDPVKKVAKDATNIDAFLWGFDLTSMDLTYSTYVGGLADDSPNTMCVDPNGILYLGLYTTSDDIFTTEGAHDGTHNGDRDAFVIRLEPEPCDVPDPPTDLRVDVTGEGAVLNWTNPGFNGALVFETRVYREIPSTPGCWTLVETLDGSACAWYDEDAGPGVRHWYRVASVNSAGEGAPSDPASDLFPWFPGIPRDLAARPIVSNGTVDLTWTMPLDHSEMDLLGYQIYRGTSPSGLRRILTVGNTTQLYDVVDDLGVVYFYSVSAFNTYGEGSMTALVSVTPRSVPSPPLNAAARPGDGWVELSWDLPTSDGSSPLMGFKVYAKRAGADWAPVAQLPASSLNYTHAGLENGVTYYYQLTALTSVGEGPPSDPITVVPGAAPTEPRHLVAVATSHEVALSWDPPERDGGWPVTAYIVRYCPSGDTSPESIPIGAVTGFTLSGLENGITYAIQVSAKNYVGEGPPSEAVMARPMGMPSAPQRLTATPTSGGIELRWSPPLEDGGSSNLTYHVLRGTAAGALEPWASLVGATSWTDQGVEVKVVYYYCLRAENEMGLGPSIEAIVRMVTVPAVVVDLSANPGNGHVLLTWSTPLDDGGSPLTGFEVLRGRSPSELETLADVVGALMFDDTTAVNGITYYYSVLARNAMGGGAPAVPLPATPLGPPGRPIGLVTRVVDGTVELEWSAPDPSGTAEVTGFRVLRGTSLEALVRIADLGLETSYADDDVKEGTTYYYSVIALSPAGPGEGTPTMPVFVEQRSQGAAPFPWWPVLVVIVVLLATVGGLGVLRRGRSLTARATSAAAPGGEVVVDLAAPASPAAAARAAHIVEQVFVVYRDGRLIADCYREECHIEDADLTSSMLIAAQAVMQDGLEKGGTLEGIKYGENNILMATGKHVNLAVVIYGEPDEGLRQAMRDAIASIEGVYARIIEDWTGELAPLEGVRDLVMPLIAGTLSMSREDIAGVEAVEGVSIHSAIGFHRGYVRLETVVANMTDDKLVDASIELHYDEDMLRLEAIEPAVFILRGDRVVLGSVRPRGVKTVSFLFDPQICHGTHIDGTLSYFGPNGEYLHVSMSRRRADVVCPIFFTRENANTAMLRRLIEERLHQSDHRVFVYPEALTPTEALRLGKRAMASVDVQTVREFVAQGPPYVAEVWYYGETKVRGYQMVMRLGVVEEGRALEVFAASTSMEQVTGFIAEFKRTLDRIVREEHSQHAAMEPSRDEALRRSLEARELLIERDGWDEAAGQGS